MRSNDVFLCVAIVIVSCIQGEYLNILFAITEISGVFWPNAFTEEQPMYFYFSIVVKQKNTVLRGLPAAPLA